MAKLLAVSTSAMNVGQGVGGGATPFVAGRNVLVYNTTAAPVILQQSPDNVVSYTTLVSVPATSFAEVTLPNWIKGAAVGLQLID